MSAAIKCVKEDARSEPFQSLHTLNRIFQRQQVEIAVQKSRNVSALRILIAFSLLSFAASLAAAYLGNSSLLKEIYRGLNIPTDRNASVATFTLLGLTIVVGSIPYIASLIGLWWCKRLARILYTILILGTTALEAMSGMDAQSALEAGTYTASSMLSGAILALIWLAMEDDFQRIPAQPREAYAA